MAQLAAECRRFAVRSGVRQDANAYVTCVMPRGALGQRKGMLTVVAEPAGEHPSLSHEACALVQEVVTRTYYSDTSLSLTSSLLKALDAANSALLEYGYSDTLRPDGTGGSSVAVQVGGSRSRRLQVGLTAFLVRPDGAGMYIAQLSPTQAYVVHNDLLYALPEPPSWQERHGKVAVTLRRVPDPADDDELFEDGEDVSDLDVDGLPSTSFPSSPLGSGTSIDVDLVYRRVEPGDTVIAVSSNLARLLDRPTAESVLRLESPEAVSEALYDLATENGVAFSHAAVLSLGTDETRGVDDELPGATIVPQIDHPAPGEAEQIAETHAAPTSIIDLLKGRDWFGNKKVEAPALFPVASSEGENAESADEPTGEAGPPPGEDHAAGYSPFTGGPFSLSGRAPTRVLLNRSVEVPPFRAKEAGERIELEPGVESETDFDGWEDRPPALSAYPGQWATAVPNPEAHAEHGATGGDADPLPSPLQSDPAVVSARSVKIAVPRIFAPAPAAEAEPQTTPGSRSRLPFAPAKIDTAAIASGAAVAGGKALTWGRNLIQNMIPDRGAEGAATPRTGKPIIVPTRVLIGAGVFVLVAVLAFSIMALARNGKGSQVTQLLTQARQEELLGNQPGAAPTERLAHLNGALEKAKAALALEPQSQEAALLAEKTGQSIDSLQGITRVDAHLLLDLDAPAPNAAGDTGASSPVSPTGKLTSVVVRGNEAYLLDSEQSKLYRCRISTRECAVALQGGETAGGQKVGALLTIVQRVDNLVALDANQTAFILDAGDSSWQAQPLGDAASLQRALGVASFDGNLYLLGAKPGQVSKYVAGKYGEIPTDWITDQATLDQMRDAVSIAIDGSIYALLRDGRVLMMQGGKLTKTITPKAFPGSTAATQLVTNTDMQGIYLFRPELGAITRLNKEGQTLSTLKPVDEAGVGALTGMTVDEGRGKAYMLSGHKVYEAGLSARRAPVPTAVPQRSEPAARPTAEP